MPKEHNVKIVLESNHGHSAVLQDALDKVEAFLSTFIDGAEGLYGPDVWGGDEYGYRHAKEIYRTIAFQMEGEAY